MPETHGASEAPLTQALDHLTALGGCWRGDWSDFDGRTLRAQLADIRSIIEAAAQGEDVTERIRVDRLGNTMCQWGGGHWSSYCDAFLCAEKAGKSEAGESRG